MDAEKRESISHHHQSNLKRGWISPNDHHFDTHIKIHSNSRVPERAREHLRAGYLNGIITERNGLAGAGEPPPKKIRTNEDSSEYNLDRHIFDSNLLSRPAILQVESPKNVTSIGVNWQQQQQQSRPQDVGEKSGERHQHKSLLITKSPGNLIGHRSNKRSSESDFYQPPIIQGKSHDLQLDCNPLLQEVALGLSQLASVLRVGGPEAEKEVSPAKDDRGEGSSIESVKCPDVSQLGLKETLRWMLNFIQSATHLAKEMSAAYQNTPPRSSPENERPAPTSTSGHLSGNSHGPLEIMKRRFLDDDFRMQHSDHSSEEGRLSQESRRDSTSRDPMQERRNTVPPGEDLPLMQSQPSFPQTSFPHLSFIGRAPTMNPPPAPYRPAPISPPGPARQSPTLYNLASPASSSAYTPQPPNTINLPSPRSITSSSLGNIFHHPNSPASSIEATTVAAANAHTAALQHDVSIRTLALQSLQQEHNNLLAAFSRSQTRAVALEKKHLVSDAEINSLSDERTRLQTQVSELEQTVEELSRSRDEARRSAVQEGSQYVQMIKMAGQLEERGREERRVWEALRGDMERRIEGLIRDRDEITVQQVRSQQSNTSIGFTTVNIPNPRAKSDQSSMNQQSGKSDTKTEAPQEPTSISTTREVAQIQSTDIVSELRTEIQKLRDRCKEYEQALLLVRSENREIDRLMEALGRAGRCIRERVDGVLGGDGEVAEKGEGELASDARGSSLIATQKRGEGGSRGGEGYVISPLRSGC